MHLGSLLFTYKPCLEVNGAGIQLSTIEVESNVVLVTYMDSDLGDFYKLDQQPLLAQRIRVTPNGIVPD